MRKLFALFLCLFDGFGFVDNGLNICVQTAEAFNAHQCVHSVLIGKQTCQRLVIHVYQQRRLPTFRQQRSRGASHSNIQNFGGIYLPHRAPIIGKHRQEIDELTDFLFRVALRHVQPAAIIRNLLQCAIQSEVKDIRLFLDNLFFAAVVCDLPRTLHAERCLKVGFGAGQIAEHENACPWFDGNAGGQLAAGECDRLGSQRIAHRLPYRLQRFHADACLCTGADIHMIIVIKRVLLLRQQICHCITGSHIGQEPQRMTQHIQKARVRKRHGRFLRPQFQFIDGRFQIRTANQIEPFLHIVLIDEMRIFAFAFGGEKDI